MTKTKSTQRTVIGDGKQVVYRLEIKKVKNINLRVRRDGSVFVSANKSVPLSKVDGFVCANIAFILRAREKFGSQSDAYGKLRLFDNEKFFLLGRELTVYIGKSDRNSVETDENYFHIYVSDPSDKDAIRRVTEKFLDGLCEEVLPRRLLNYYPVFEKQGISQPTIRLRAMTGKWGSCIKSKGKITLNKCLIFSSTECIDYVCLHELCHLIHPNHSEFFYELLTSLMPDWKQRKRKLNERPPRWI